MAKKKSISTKHQRHLGMDQNITRRDFLNASLLGAGSALMHFPSPSQLLGAKADWNGYGGVGDYKNSNGNTWEVLSVGHEVRDGRYDHVAPPAVETGEDYDLVVVGGGLSGLGAAFYFTKEGRPNQKCLVIENHPIFGGEAKQNEFIVNGQRLIGPQGSNNIALPQRPGAANYGYFEDLGIPRQYEYQTWDSKLKPLVFARDNYGFQLWFDSAPSFGFFFEDGPPGSAGRWLHDIWGNNLQGTPFPANLKQDLLASRSTDKKYYEGPDVNQWLDTMTYKDYVEKVMGLDPGVTRYLDPISAGVIGLGCDAISAYGALQVQLPGFKFAVPANPHPAEYHSFPGGNSAIARYFIKALVPESISGERKLEDIASGRVKFDTLDRPANPVRVRVGATAVRVEHIGESQASQQVSVIYTSGGQTYRVKAKGVVMAGGSWITRHVVRDLPEDYRLAYDQFYRSPVLVVNVALTNWRFLYKLGLTACRWFEGFGFCCNIRQPMVVGGYRPPLDPKKPIVLTFYVPFYYPGKPIRDQGAQGRAELFSTSYAEYERQIREQIVRLFGAAGFNPRTDIAGIILNRWGHAYLDPQPGFYFGRDGKPAPRDVVRGRFGRITFANSELNGHQNWPGAVGEGRRAMKQLLEVI